MCGLKLIRIHSKFIGHFVTPFVGVWIETRYVQTASEKMSVTPFVGVWIETRYASSHDLPLGVTPFVGVWIETALPIGILPSIKCHTLRGCVD